MDDGFTKCADRLRSLIVAGTGLVAGLVFWMALRPGFDLVVPSVFDPDPSRTAAVAGSAALLALLGYGIWRYGVIPLAAVHRACGPAAARAFAGRVFRVCWPYGLAAGAVLAPLGADLPWGFDVVAFACLLWGWDWMKWASDARLASALAAWDTKPAQG